MNKFKVTKEVFTIIAFFLVLIASAGVVISLFYYAEFLYEFANQIIINPFKMQVNILAILISFILFFIPLGVITISIDLINTKRKQKGE